MFIYERSNSFVKKGEVYLKTFLNPKTNHFSHQTIPALQGNNCDAASKAVCISEFLSINMSVKKYEETLLLLRCRSNNMSKCFISSIANSPKINKVLMQRLHKRAVFVK